jgi:YfiH family protein
VVAAAHAGWRGALDGILEATLDDMEAAGARREDVRAVIGPTISQRAYEVGAEFLERFMDDDADNARFFINGADGKYLFDLPGYGLKRLRDAGVGAAEWTRHCTYSDADRFYSYRRSVHRGEADYGRLISAIRL